MHKLLLSTVEQLKSCGVNVSPSQRTQVYFQLVAGYVLISVESFLEKKDHDEESNG
jgi:hypothetical protein